MNDTTICIPLNADGTIHHRLGQTHLVATCQVRDDVVSEWNEHVVDWDQTYGVDVLGVHHPRVLRFMQANGVTTVIANDVCASMQRVLTKIGVDVHTQMTGDARAAVGMLATA